MTTLPHRLLRFVVLGLGRLSSVLFVGLGACTRSPKESAPLATEVEWRLAERPSVLIGSDTSRSAAFGRVSGALRLSGGSILVSDLSPPELKLFDSAGRYVRTVGRTGSGPGEFKWLAAPQRFAGDSFYVVDMEQRRVSFFDAEANHVASRRFTLQLLDGRVFFPFGAVSSVQFVGTLTEQKWPTRVGERVRNPVEIVTGRFGASSAFQTITKGRGDERVGGVWTESGNNLVAAYRLEFGSTTQVALESAHIYVGESAMPRVQVYDLTGKLLREVAWDHSVDPVTEADRLARIAQESTRISGLPPSRDPAQLWSAVEHLRTVKLPKYAAAFTGLLPVAGGGLWVEQDPRQWTASRRYLVFDSSGAMLARIEVPRQLTIYQVGDDFVLGRWREPGEADEVRVYGIDR